LKTFWQNLRQAWQPDPPSDQESELAPSIRWAWVLPNRLKVGSFPEVPDLDCLKQGGIQAILTLCDPAESRLDPAFSSSFHCLQYSLPDSRHSRPLLVEDLATVVDLLHETLQTQGPTYVHCLAGIERSPTVCVAYLCRYQRLQVWEALNWLKSIHARTGITSDQLRVISTYLAEATEE
jgi:atypical dual specificity phosphatase